MTNISGWVTFRQIIDDVMLAQGDYADVGQFMRYLNFAIKGYSDLRLHALPATKSIPVTIDGEMRSVIMPDDFLKFVSIGKVAGGKFYEFVPNSSMNQSTTADCGITSRTQPDLTDHSVFTAYYSVDIENRRILIDGPLSMTSCTLNYTPTGVKTDGSTMIPRMCAPVIGAWVEYQAAIRDRDKNVNDKMMLQNEYMKEYNKFLGLQYNVGELFKELYEHLATGKQY